MLSPHPSIMAIFALSAIFARSEIRFALAHLLSLR